MGQKIVFLDIDGTLVNFSGKIPESARLALSEARSKGNLLYICSGRSYYQIHPELMDMGFDGFVAAAGSHVICNGKTIFHKFMTDEDVVKLVKYLDENDFTYDMQTENYAVFNKKCYERAVKRFTQMGLSKQQQDVLLKGAVIREDIRNSRGVEKIVYSDATKDFKQICMDLTPRFTLTASSLDGTGDSGEIGVGGVNKALGMEKCLEYLHIKREDSFAFGDGANDFEMMEYAGVGIAMGNAIEPLKQKADYVTTSIDDNGIYNAFEKYGLI